MNGIVVLEKKYRTTASHVGAILDAFLQEYRAEGTHLNLVAHRSQYGNHETHFEVSLWLYGLESSNPFWGSVGSVVVTAVNDVDARLFVSRHTECHYSWSRREEKAILGEARIFFDKLAAHFQQVFEEPVAPKQRGHYRLTPQQIEERSRIVADARKMMKDDPKLTLVGTARRLGEHVTTLKDWLHDPRYG